MAHKYEYHVDVRDTSGFYLGALTHILSPQARHLHIRSFDMPPIPAHAHLDDPLSAVWVRELSIPLTLWTICERAPGTVLWSERDCVIVGDGDFLVLLDGGYIVPYNQDPFIDDRCDWITSFIHATQNRRNQ